MWYNYIRIGGNLVAEGLIGIGLFLLVAIMIDFIAEGFSSVYV